MIHVHTSGILLNAPQSRTSSKGGSYVTGMIKCSSKDGDALVSSFTSASLLKPSCCH